MSHFMTVVLLPKGTTDIKAEVGRLLAPYDENLEVPEYDQRCWCVGRQAEREADDEADKQVGTVDALRTSFHAAHGDKPEDEQDALWRQHFAPHVAAAKVALEAHPLKDAADPECEECNGTGTHKSTSNPKRKWDYWRIGGRWDGAIQGKPRESDRGFNWGDEHESLTYNLASAADLIEQEPPFAIVTPDGEWHERGRMGWFALVADEKDDWPAQAKAIFEQYRGSCCLARPCPFCGQDHPRWSAVYRSGCRTGCRRWGGRVTGCA